MKKSYTQPRLENLGPMVVITQTGLTNPGADGKSGSRPSQGN